jgi:hypothetical protein
MLMPPRSDGESLPGDCFKNYVESENLVNRFFIIMPFVVPAYDLMLFFSMSTDVFHAPVP